MATVLLLAASLYGFTGSMPAQAEDANGSWHIAGSLLQGRVGHTATLLPDGRILLTGGRTSTAELLDPATGQSSPTGSMAHSRYEHTATLLNGGRVLVVGGRDENGATLGSAELFDPNSGEWSSAGDDPGGPRADHTATWLGGTVLVVGGFGTAVGTCYDVLDPCVSKASASVYTPPSPGSTGPGSWTSVERSMSTARARHSANVVTGPLCDVLPAPLSCGKVLVAGGTGIVNEGLNYDDTAGAGLAELYDPISGTWMPTGNLTHNRQGHTATVLNDGKVLVAGGQNCLTSPLTVPDPSASIGLCSPTASAELYDPVTGTWSPTSPLSERRFQHAAVLLASDECPPSAPAGSTGEATDRPSWCDMVLVAGGLGAAYLSSSEMFDPDASGTDETGRPVTGDWVRAGALVDARAAHTLTAIGAGGAIAAGGQRAETSVELFDPIASSGRPSVGSIDPASGPTSGKTGVVIKGAGFSEVNAVRFGERNASFYRVESSTRIIATSPPAGLPGPVPVTVETSRGTSTHTVRDRFTYYEAGGSWSATGAMATPREAHTASVLPDARVLVTGGYLPGTPGPSTASSEIFVPTTEEWQTTRPMNHARGDHTATVLEDGTLLVAGGRTIASGTPTDTAETYDPESGKWTTTGRMNVARHDHTATLLPDGRVLVVGGGEFSDQKSSEVYDPPSRTWTAVAQLSQPRSNHTATDMGVGRILVVGGTSSPKTAEMFDPTSSTWRSVSASLGYGRASHTATLVPGDRILVTGGGTDSIGTDTSEMFQLHPGGVESWDRTLGRMSTPRQSGHSATDLGGGKVLVAGGQTGVSPDKKVLASTQVYDTDAEAWVPRLPLLTERSGHTATRLVDGRVLVTGGMDGQDRRLASAEIFDPSSSQERISLLSATPAVGTTSGGTSVRIVGSGLFDPETRVTFGGIPAQSVMVTSDREIIAVSPPHPPGEVVIAATAPRGTSRSIPYHYGAGGWSPASPLDQCQPGIGSCAGRSEGHTATAIADGKVLVAGGSAAPPVGHSSSAQLYDPKTGSWAPAVPMMTPRSRHVAVPLVDGTALVIGGRNTTTRSDVGRLPEVYNPVLGVWLPTGPMGTGRSEGHTATRLQDGRVLVAGGSVTVPSREIPVLDPLPPIPEPGTASESTDDVELYDPTTRQWTATTTLKESRRNHTATLLQSGRVLVAGGVRSEHIPQNTNTILDSAEIYDPDSRTWTAASLGAPRWSHTATLLSDGRVLIVGGEGAEGTLASAEIYDPRTGSWVAAAGLHEARSGHTATSLPGGRVLVAGGSMNRHSLASSEIYDPITDQWSYAASMATARSLHTGTVIGGEACGSLCGRVLVVGAENPASATSELYSASPEVTSVTPALGPTTGGTPVVISGRFLDQASSVSFGGVPASSFTVVSPTQIAAVTPAHEAGTVEVVVTTPGGSSLANPPRPNEFTFVSSGVPGGITDLAAKALSEAAVELSWTTAGSDGVFGPPATRYVLKETTSPIADEAAFDAATSVCEGACPFPAASLGRSITFSINGLTPGTDYYYAVRAVGPNGVEGPISNSVSVTTVGIVPVLESVCPALPAPSPDQVVYPSGYSMVGLPAGTRVGAQSPLYGWFDLGARGAYSTQSGGDPVAEGRGYWAWFSCPRLVTVAGPGASNLDLPLGGYRASMVGNPSGTRPAVVSGHDFAARWDPNLNGGAGGYRISGHREDQFLAVGQAAWVFSYRDTSINLRRQ